MRSKSGLVTIRPADTNEVREAWKVVLQLHHQARDPAIYTTAVPTDDRTKYVPAFGLARGAYVVADTAGRDPEVILIGTGKDFVLCIRRLMREGIRARVVSIPSWELFHDQDPPYRDSLLPHQVKARISVELGSDFG